MDPAIYDEMFALEDRHWWFRARRRIVMDLLRRHVSRRTGEKPRIADLGCGCGANLQAYLTEYDAWGVDAAPAAVHYTRRRVGDRVLAGALPGDLPLPAGQFDAVVMTDVLEHIDDDRASAAAAVNLLAPDGVFIATVPAGQWLFCARDVAHHHKRRYDRRQLRDVFANLPVNIELLSHCNTTLFPIAAASRLASRFRPATSATDLRIPLRPLNDILEATFAGERHLLGRVPLPFGLSLVVVARRLAGEVPEPASLPRSCGASSQPSQCLEEACA